MEEVRIDKWLWAVRIYKTRSLASDECKKGRVVINNDDAKPSKTIKSGDIISVRKPPVYYKYLVKKVSEKRMGAKLVDNFYEDITPQEELDKLLNKQKGFFPTHKGMGRPTKKDRRKLDDFKQNN
jgi:ribosome-associated heat shock protein Hsp15